MPRQLLRRHFPSHDNRQSPSPSSPPPAPRMRNSHAQPVPGPAARPQFQTPPSREPLPAAAPARHSPASAQAALFSLFGRGVVGRPRPQMMDDDDPDQYDSGLERTASALDDETEGDVEDEEGVDEGMVGEDEEGEEDVDVEDEDEDEDELMRDREKSPSPLPPNLREISNLASWCVSTHKPGFGVSALRHPSPSQYWQSDGPQPHTLTLHFFKLVAVVKIRVFLDFDSDESYTPTRMIFLAGMGGNDLVEFATWEGEGPCGWVDVSLDGVGGRDGGWVENSNRRRRRRMKRRRKMKGISRITGSGFSPSPGKRKLAEWEKRAAEEKRKRTSTASTAEYILSESEDSEFDFSTFDPNTNPHSLPPSSSDSDSGDSEDPYDGNVLKAMVIQMRVIENHQNGKDTHVRGFQVFARDDERMRAGTAPSASADNRARRTSARKSLRGGLKGEAGDEDGGEARIGGAGLEEPEWMGVPVIR